jgi:hypothetical protein
MQDAKTQSNNAYALGGQYNAPVASYYTNAMQNGFGTPDQIRSWGQAAMPGVDAAMQNINNAYAGVQTPGSTTGQQNANIGATQAYNDAAYNQINQGNNTAFNNAKNLTSNMYGSLIPQTAQAYQAAQSNLQRLMPGGDLLAANAAQAFAPQVAATNRSLRMSGIDPNSAEASGQVQAVQAARGRSMDDVLAQNMGNYVSQGNALTLGGNQAQTQLGLGRTNDMNNLSLQQNSTNNQSAQSQMAANQNLMNQRNQVVQNMRDMGMQDAQIQQQLQTLGLNLNNQQFQAGLQGMGLNLQQQNQGAQGLGGLATQQYNLGNATDNSARAWNQQAYNQYGGDLGVEGQNAGWGTKLLGGLAMGGLNLIAPGAGTALGGAIPGMGSIPNLGGIKNWLGGLGSGGSGGGFGYPNPGYGGAVAGTA